jgi:hypothetical protein
MQMMILDVIPAGRSSALLRTMRLSHGQRNDDRCYRCQVSLQGWITLRARPMASGGCRPSSNVESDALRLVILGFYPSLVFEKG